MWCNPHPPPLAPVRRISASAIARPGISAHRQCVYFVYLTRGGRMLGARNYAALTADQIERCLAVWKELCGDIPRPLDLSEAARHGSRTRYDADRHVVIL